MRRFRHLAARHFSVGVILGAAAFFACAVAFSSAVAWAAPIQPPEDVGLVAVRLGGDTTTTRVVLDLDAAVSGKFVADESTPGHIVIALPPLLSTGPLQGPGKGLVTSWSVSVDAGGARLMLEAPPGATIVRRFLIPPSDDNPHWRYVIDLRNSAADPLTALLDGAPPRAASAPGPAAAPPVVVASARSDPPAAMPPVAPTVTSGITPISGAPRYATRAPWSPAPAPDSVTAPVSASAPRPAALPPQRPAVVAVRTTPQKAGAERGMKVIVIDPGHGGHDTGAQSLVRNEKDITLAAALSLRAHLLKMGHYRVVMTRDSDIFIPLETRVQIARRAGADLFISLHADSAGSDPTPHGASVYTLSDVGETRVNYVLGPREWLSRAGDGRTTADVRQILLDLTQRNTRNRSSEFAGKLLSHIGDKVDLLPRSHRDANYFVLLAPDVPAVLLEMGFITNPGDQMRLTDPEQRDKLTAGIADAIDDYFYGATRLTAGF